MAFLAFVLAATFTGQAMAATTPATSQTALTVSTDNSQSRTLVTLNAHVAALSGTEVPGGVMNFRSGALDLGSAVIDGDGNASLSTNNLPAGTNTVSAVYQGSASFQSSVSAMAQVTSHQSTVAGFTAAASPTTLSVVGGNYVTSQITITPGNGFDGYVSLSCEGLPLNSTCTFNPTTVLAQCTTSGTTQTCTPVLSTMQIQTQGTSGPINGSNGEGRSGPPGYAFAIPALFAFTGWAGFRKRGRRGYWNALLLVAVLLPGALALTACNPRYYYLNHGPAPATGTNGGTYTVTVDAVSSSGSELTTPPTNPQLTLTITGS